MELDQDLLLQTFLSDAEEHVNGLEETLLSWEQGTRGEDAQNRLARHAHSLKGDASILGFEAIVEMSHRIEDGLPCLAGDEEMVTAAVAVLLRAVDALRELIARAAEATPSLSPAHQEVLGALRTLQTPGGRSTPLPATQLEWVDPTDAVSGRDASRGTLRVDVARLDEMLRLTGEVAIARSRLLQAMESGRGAAEAIEVHREADRLYMDLQEVVMNVRLVPLEPLFRRHVRTARDLGKHLQKRVRVEIEAHDVEMDTGIVAQLREPLMHMVRNAVAHGIETPAARARRGKDPVGIVRLTACHEGGSILVEVTDDGAGLDSERILRRARERGLIDASEQPSDAQIRRLILEPGFSTAERLTEVSGRGVGMDVVRASVENLGGTLTMQSTLGEGTTFQLRLPLTLAIIDGFSVQVGSETCVIPLDQVIECVELPDSARDAGDGCGVLSLREEALPFVRLRSLFGFDTQETTGHGRARENVVVVEHRGTRAGFVVDQLHGHLQTVIKPLHRLFQSVVGLSGSAIAGDGRVALILDVPSLVQEALDAHARKEPA